MSVQQNDHARKNADEAERQDGGPDGDQDGRRDGDKAIDRSSKIDRNLGQRLRTLRLHAGKKQSDIAREISISTQQYQKYEKGAAKCSLTRLYALASFYGISISELLPPSTHKSGGFQEEPESFNASNASDSGNEVAAISELLTIFTRIPSAKTRRKILDLLNEIA